MSYELNMERINRRINTGLEILKENYSVIEQEVSEPLRRFTVAGRVHAVRQFEIAGVGNLLVMTNPERGPMQMDTFTITPYFKNLPLFTTDYMYWEDKRALLNEVYNLVDYQDELYLSYIEKFAANCQKYAHLPDMPLKPCWYDGIRPVVAAKAVSPEHDDETFALFIDNLRTFIDMEKASPLLEGDALKGKWTQNYEYARRLVEDGGVSTALFVDSLGADNTKEFFYSVFFAPDKFRPAE